MHAPRDHEEGPLGRGGISSTLLRTIVESTRDSVVVTRATMEGAGPRILYVNRSFTEMTGFEPAAALGRTPSILQGPRTERRVLDQLRGCLAAGEPFEGETVNYRKNGEAFVNHWYIETLRPKDTDEQFYLAVQRDVTIERRTQATAGRLLTAVESLGDFVMIVDGGDCVYYANPAAALMLQLTRGELVQAMASRLPVRTKLDDERLDVLLRSLGDELWHGELMLRPGRSQPIRLEAQVIPTSFGGARSFVIVGRNKTAEQRVEAVASALNMTNNTGYIFAGIRHELGNPVNSLKSALTVLRSGRITDPGRVAEYLARCSDEVDRMEYLLRSMKSVDPSRGLDLHPIDLCRFLETYHRLTEPDLVAKGLVFRVEVPTEPVMIDGDDRALHQVLVNLVGNAAATLEQMGRSQLSISLCETGDTVDLIVEDDGAGMTPQQLDRLFQPFQTQKASGTGLGLVIVQRLVAQMKGVISVDSKPGRGTRFTLSFPGLGRA